MEGPYASQNLNRRRTIKKALVTGAGTGFGYEAAMRLAEKGFDVIASVEIWAQKQTEAELERRVGAFASEPKVRRTESLKRRDSKDGSIGFISLSSRFARLRHVQHR